MRHYNLNLRAGVRLLMVALCAILLIIDAHAQISGTVFRDYNGNGSRQNTSGTFVEPLVPGVIVTAYNASDVILASYTSAGTSSPNYSIPVSGTYNGTLGSNTGGVPNGTAVRLEFTIPGSSACLVNKTYDFSSMSGKVYGTSVRFVAGSQSARTGNDFALNNPAEYVAGSTPKTSTYLFTAVQFNGNPAGGGSTASENALVKFPYNSNGATTALTSGQKLANAQQVGSIYGVAYSKQANRVFASAYMKRHSGFGPANGTFKNAPGAIYIVNPNLSSTSSTKAASYFTSLDALGYPTHNYETGAPDYGSGASKSYTLSSSGSGNSRTETITFNSNNGVGVIGTNTERGLPKDINGQSNDAAAYGQVGKVGLGAIELSGDGKHLFVVNLYDRKVYQLKFDSPTSPTSVSVVNSWALPNPPARSASGLTGAATTYGSATADFYNGTVGYQRPFALKYYRGKMYVGALTTGEGTGAVSTTDNNSGNCEYTDLWAYVWELTPGSGFSTTPVLQFPLNYNKGTNTDNYNETWKAWTNTMPGANVSTGNGGQWSLVQPMFTGIEFDSDGSMIVGIRDRSGDLGGFTNYMLSGTTTRTAMAFGDLLRAYKNPSGCKYELESNGKEGPNSSKAATAGKDNGGGPGGGEFYYQDGLEMYNGSTSDARYHMNTASGGLALLPGMEEASATMMDPMDIWSGGVSWMNSNTGGNPRDFQLYKDATTGAIGKANGMGDIELLLENAPLEVGNRIWKDVNGDGIQGADEPGIAGVLLELLDKDGNAVDGDPSTDGVQATLVTTDSNGNWYITSASGTDAVGINYGVSLLPNTEYIVRLATSGTGNDWDPTANSGAGAPRTGGALVGLELTVANQVGNGESDLSDSDATLVSSIPAISFTTGDYGQNDHTLDIGFAPYGSIGDYVWYDTNYDGLQTVGEAVAPGVTVTLWKSTDGGTTWDEDFATTTTDANGKYLFGQLKTATYRVVFTKPAGYEYTTKGTTANATDDSNVGIDGASGNISINTELDATDLGRNNPTIDAGLIAYGSIGDYVWYDTNYDGLQTVGEAVAPGVTVTLWKSTDGGTTWDEDFATTTTDANGKYLFDQLKTATYRVVFTKPAGYEYTTKGTTANATDDSNVGTDGASGNISINTELDATDLGRNNPTIDAGLVAYGSIGDYVWYDTNYDGLQTVGEAVAPGVTVTLWKSTDGGTTWDEDFATTTTDANGKYLFDQLKTATYRVVFTKPAGYEYTTKGTTANAIDDSNVGTDGASGNISINTALDATDLGRNNPTIDAGLVAYGSIGDYVWYDTNYDGLQTVGEAVAPGVTVTLWKSTDGGTTWDEDFATTTTDANGKYLFDQLKTATYRVVFTKPAGYEYTTKGTTANATDDSNVGTDGASGNISINTALDATDLGRNNPTIDAGLVAYGSIGDYVWYDTNYDGLQTVGEAVAPGVTVTLWKSTDGGTTWDEDFATTTTDANGKYLFDQLKTATYRVVFTKPAGYEYTTKGTTANATDDSNVGTDGASGNISINTALDATDLGRNNPTIDAGLVAYGSIGDYVWFDKNKNGKQDSDEDPVEGVVVKLWKFISNLEEWEEVSSTTTDAQGKYLFGELKSGSYKVQFIEPTGADLTYFQKDGTDESEDSDAGFDGFSDRIQIDVTLPSGDIGRDNPTIDAGLVDEGALPVSLTNFKVIAGESKSVRLFWSTTTEVNSSLFEVQRSSTGKEWQTVGTVLAKGQSTQTISYSFVDSSPLNGQNVYRLKMVDRDGTFGYSVLRNIEMRVTTILNLFPNPTRSSFKIEAYNGVTVKNVQVYSGIGKMVSEVSHPVDGMVSLNGLESGMYVLRITMSDGTTEIRKIILNR